jgi:hypothetical protein
VPHRWYRTPAGSGFSANSGCASRYLATLTTRPSGRRSSPGPPRRTGTGAERCDRAPGFSGRGAPPGVVRELLERQPDPRRRGEIAVGRDGVFSSPARKGGVMAGDPRWHRPARLSAGACAGGNRQGQATGGRAVGGRAGAWRQVGRRPLPTTVRRGVGQSGADPSPRQRPGIPPGSSGTGDTLEQSGAVEPRNGS